MRTERFTRPPLGAVLVDAGALAERTLAAALEEQRRDGGRLGALLQARGDVEPEALRTALAAHFAMGTVGDDDVPVALLPAVEARRLRAVALWPTAAHERFGARVVAFGDPTPDRIAAAARHLGREVRPLVVDDQTLDDLLERAYATEDDVAVAHAFRTSREERRPRRICRRSPWSRRWRASRVTVSVRSGPRWTASTTRWPSCRASRSSTPTTRRRAPRSRCRRRPRGSASAASGAAAARPARRSRSAACAARGAHLPS